MKQYNYVKRAARTFNIGISYDNIISAVANILNATNTMEEYTDSILLDILPLSSDTIKYAFIHMSGNISDLTYLKKKRVALDI